MSIQGHTCEALVLSCIDFRFHEALLKYVRGSLGIEKFDLVALAGGAKNLATPAKPGYEEAVIDNIGIARRLHGITKVVLTNHMDCGAYGGSAQFPGSREEHAFHENELRKATARIATEFPDLSIECVFVFFKEDGSIDCKRLS